MQQLQRRPQSRGLLGVQVQPLLESGLRRVDRRRQPIGGVPEVAAGLLREAVDFASDHTAARISSAATGLDVLDAVVSGFRKQLAKTDYRAGCPVVAVAVEAGDPAKDENAAVLERAGAAFSR